MTKPVDADLIWNRACLEPVRSLPGDRALADMLYAHGLTANGGVLHAVESMTADELADAQDGYRYFGLHEVASLLARARSAFESGSDLAEHERQFDLEYNSLVPSDGSLAEHFEMKLSSRALDFAPLPPAPEAD